jgi:heme/copper-type cytochrome/quinol oxidase subunit 2
VSHAREKFLACREDLAKAGKMIEKQRVAVILLSVFLGVMVFGGVLGLLLLLSRRSKKRAQERAEGRVIELQVRAGGAGEEAK